jgi:hypothetical protein
VGKTSRLKQWTHLLEQTIGLHEKERVEAKEGRFFSFTDPLQPFRRSLLF